MKIKDYQCKCGHDDFFFADKGNQKGIYCSYCGKWFKWADKDEQNLAMKQAFDLNEIRAKIAAKIGGNGSENDGLDKALAIIDEYIRESKE